MIGCVVHENHDFVIIDITGMSMTGEHVFVGFGFGPIQSGLFVAEAFKSGCFKRIVVAEINGELVEAIRANQGAYAVNVASSQGIDVQSIQGIEVLNPLVDRDRALLVEALAQATEIVTSLPAVDFYEAGKHPVASLIRSGLEASRASGTLIYTAENNNHAAEILEKAVHADASHPVQYLNTVVGKMSQVLTDPQLIQEKDLAPITPNTHRAFLVEAFNHILVSECQIPGFVPGISVFSEKPDLLPFEEAKLYGHNAIHFLLAMLGVQKGHTRMKSLRADRDIMAVASNAFIQECGAALIKKHGHLGDTLFTEDGFLAYAQDLLDRMTNPFLDDPIERIARDPERKLGCHDRIFGTMKLALDYGITPVNMTLGAAAGIQFLQNQVPTKPVSQG